MRKIFIQRDFWQTRVAVLDETNRLQDLYFESYTKSGIEKSFFKGKIVKMLPGIQTAFVDIGQQRSGFLHVTEIDRSKAQAKFASEDEDLFSVTEGPSTVALKDLDISKVYKEGDELLIQVIKEPVYEKGAKLSTCFTLPGKFIVLMPTIPHLGVSRKIESPEERARLREVIGATLPDGMGAIVRTTAENKSIDQLKRDIDALVNEWKVITNAYKKAKIGQKIHEDLPIVLRVLREMLDDDVEAVVFNSKEDLTQGTTFVKEHTPEFVGTLKLYSEQQPMFDRYEIEKQIDPLLNRKVPLKSGGTLIIESAEAMTVIDVNTGRYTGKDNLENTIFKTNLEAAEEIVRQLRLRNIGGLIVIDFIDMFKSGNRQKLSKHLEKTLKEKDRYQSVALKISEFGLVQMTRKRSGKTLVQQLAEECSFCKGNGFVRSAATNSYTVLGGIARDLQSSTFKGEVTAQVSLRVFDYLLDTECDALLAFEKQLGCTLLLESNETLEGASYHLTKGKQK